MIIKYLVTGLLLEPEKQIALKHFCGIIIPLESLTGGQSGKNCNSKHHISSLFRCGCYKGGQWFAHVSGFSYLPRELNRQPSDWRLIGEWPEPQPPTVRDHNNPVVMGKAYCVCVSTGTGVGEPPAEEPLHRGRPLPWPAQVPGEVQDVRTHQCPLRPLQLPVPASAHGQLNAPGDHRYEPCRAALEKTFFLCISRESQLSCVIATLHPQSSSWTGPLPSDTA